MCGACGHITGNAKPYGQAAFKYLYDVYKIGAKRRNLEFELSQDQFRSLTKAPCHYCGVEPQSTTKHRIKHANGDYIHNGIDRVNNSVGYTIDNCVPCCKTCNRMKHKLDKQAFLAHVCKIQKTKVAAPQPKTPDVFETFFDDPASGRLKLGQAAFNSYYASCERSAKKKGRDFQLSQEMFFELTRGACCYCGAPPLASMLRYTKYLRGDYLHNGIDRIDNDQGYVASNCRSCCATCNMMRGTLSVAQFLDQAARISANHADS
jgi:5-methylcytosine-specific restriction endonuclease McrA